MGSCSDILYLPQDQNYIVVECMVRMNASVGADGTFVPRVLFLPQ